MTHGLERVVHILRLFGCVSFSAVQRKGHDFQCTFINYLVERGWYKYYIALCYHKGGCHYCNYYDQIAYIYSFSIS